MSDYQQNLRVHNVEIFWSPGGQTDDAINQLITDRLDNLMRDIIVVGAKDPSISNSFHIGLREEDI